MSTGKRIIQKTTAMLLIFILTLAEFALVGQVAISYAVDAVRTNNKNVEISAYFENENGEKIANIESAINANLKLIAEITVKNENGNNQNYTLHHELKAHHSGMYATPKVSAELNLGKTNNWSLVANADRFGGNAGVRFKF